MNVKDRPRLGKGLKSLISHPVTVALQPAHNANASNGERGASDLLSNISLTHIAPNPHQPRSAMDPVGLNELAASIRASGVLQPVIVRPVLPPSPGQPQQYQLIAGHRRTEAAKIAGLTHIPAIVRQDSSDEHQAEWALVENIQRQDLNAIDRAKAYRAYVEKFHLTHAQAAGRLGEDRTTISNFLRLLDLNVSVQDLIGRGVLSAGHAKVLAGVSEPARQEALANRVVAEGLSVRKLEELINTPESPPLDGHADTTSVSAHARTIIAKSPHVIDLEQELSRKLGTKLRIFPSKKKNTGKIIIQYFSLDEFDRIIERFN